MYEAAEIFAISKAAEETNEKRLTLEERIRAINEEEMLQGMYIDEDEAQAALCYQEYMLMMEYPEEYDALYADDEEDPWNCYDEEWDGFLNEAVPETDNLNDE